MSSNYLSSNYLIGHILYQIFKNIMSILSKTARLISNLNDKINWKTKDENGKNVLHLEITEVVLVHCNIVNNNYQLDSRILYTFVTGKSFGQLLDISPKTFIFLKTFDSEFPYSEVWFTDQNSKPLQRKKKHYFSY